MFDSAGWVKISTHAADGNYDLLATSPPGEGWSVIVASDPSFSERLKQLRETAGLTQYALAKKSGVTAQAIAKLERGDTVPSWDTVRKLARALDVSVAAFDDTGEGPREPEEPPSPAKKPTPKKPKH